MQITRELAKYNILPFKFMIQNIAASQTDVQMKDDSATLGQVDGISLPFDGELVAVAIDLNAAATAGSLAIGVTNGGTENATTVQTLTTGTAAYKVFPRGTMKFVAGDKIGAEYTTSADWNGTTVDCIAILYVALAVQGI